MNRIGRAILTWMVLLSASHLAEAGVIENITQSTFHATIQDAIDLADPGDSIVVGPDATPYAENLLITRPLSLMSSAGAAGTTISGGGLGTVITVDSVTGPVLVKGFTIKDGDTTLSGGGAGIHIAGSSDVTVRDNIIRDNSAIIAGAGITVFSSTASIIGNLIRENSAGGAAGLPTGGIWAGKAPMSAVPSTVSIVGNNIRANAGLSSGGITIEGESAADVVSNFLVGNTGSGLLYAGSGLVANNAVTGNAAGGVGGVYVASSAIVDIINNTIAGNFGSSVGGLFLEELLGTLVPTAHLRNNIIIGNDDDGSPGPSPKDFTVAGLPLHIPGTTLSVSHNQLGVSSVTLFSAFGGSNIGLPAVFIDLDPASAGMPTEAGDYHLPAEFPPFSGMPPDAVDAGTSTDPKFLAAGLLTDLDGHTRIFGPSVDMGAFEVIPEPATILLLAPVVWFGLNGRIRQRIRRVV